MAGRRLLDLLFVRGVVEAVEEVAYRTRLLRLSGAVGLEWTPGQQVRVHVKDLLAAQTWLHGLRDVLRTYSVWDYEPETGRLELYVLDHDGAGPGTRWAHTAEPGQEVVFGKPEGRFVTRPAAYHVFVGEETACVPFGAMLRALPAAEAVHGAIEIARPEGRLPLPRGEELTWRYRGDKSAASSLSLVEAVRGLSLPAEPGVAYVAGEARTVQAVRDHFVRERGWPRGAVLVKPFWTPGKRGLE
ncbi:NADPH-dependent ferric siderophore reductase, contains FAD-binding and SIP domains [Thermomonospora echinospora]|uniref:NADPH-dependent ferric siderophore reductase, contains FAD-binding and SIP domains n=1 Tax=Thermomonospora echinospora TaxID=1992 RepID=A0A1H6D6X0_9ACTN|nr:siderophore-interacting protein [Thermomonospora echinospora]SEG80814.1 NADPH-dependent ferric siderophore reductase, contains FAD-binding and SIP domains [Thermomonospora echinospora]